MTDRVSDTAVVVLTAVTCAILSAPVLALVLGLAVRAFRWAAGT